MWLRVPENKINRKFYEENYFKGSVYLFKRVGSHQSVEPFEELQ